MNNQTTTANGTKTSSSDNTLALLTFKVAGQEYGLPVISVARIIEMVTIIHIPNIPNVIQGIINLHGKTVPVMDLRRRLGLPHQPYGLHTPIILVDAAGDGRMLGLIVDKVEQIFNIPSENLEATETIVPAGLMEQMTGQTTNLVSLAKVDRQMILVLDVRTLLNSTEQIKLSQALNNSIPVKIEAS